MSSTEHPGPGGLIARLQSWVDGLDGSEERGMLKEAIAGLNASDRMRGALEELRDELLNEPQLLDVIDAALSRASMEQSND